MDLSSMYWEPDYLLPNASAWVGHIPFAFWLTEAHQPQTFVELGTHYGHSYFAFCQAAKALQLGTKCFAIDTWTGDEHAGYYDEEVFSAVSRYNSSQYPDSSKLIRSTFDAALSHFEDGTIDVLHIDGHHTFESASHDFETWLPKLSRRGLVLLHDTNVHTDNFGVYILLAQLRDRYPIFEFHHAHGLSVVGVGSKQTKHIQRLFECACNPVASTLIRTLFARLGYGCELLGRLRAQESHVSQLKETMGNLTDNIRELTSQKESLRMSIRSLRTELAAVRSSTSWRLTAPYRAVGDRIRGLACLISNIAAAGRTPQGFSRVLAAIAARLNSHGLQPTRDTRSASSVAYYHQAARLNYQAWVESFDTIDDEHRQQMQHEIADWKDQPLISIVMPVYNPPITFLRAAIESVLRQVYPHWELCIADDCSSDECVANLLREYSSLDKRIRVTYLENNRGISEASNAALRLAHGNWVALLDHDDALAEHALFLLAKAIREFPDAQLFYSDEDKIDERGYRYDPYFKPDWNKALFRSHNLITHLGVYRATIARELGGFRRDFDGAQDYDLALRFIENIQPSEVVHIPHILYHWRAHANSTAHPTSRAKPYALLSGVRALEEHLGRCRQDADVELLGHGFRVRYKLNEAPKVSLLIPTKDRVELISRCLESILSLTTYPNYEIIVIDNGTTETSAATFLHRASLFPRVRVVRVEGEFNFSLLNNRAVEDCDGEVLALLNNDLEAMQSDWLQEMVSHAVQPDVGAVGALLLFPDNTIQHAGVVLGIGGIAGHSHKGFPTGQSGYFGRNRIVSEFSAVTAACLVVRKTLYQEAGGLDELNLKVAFNDVDFCLRLRELGYRNVFTPYACFYHHESASRGHEDTPEKMRRFESEVQFMKARWGARLLTDPAYNPNLTLETEDFAFAWPPRIDRLSVRPAQPT